jgi:hypothetical protein
VNVLLRARPVELRLDEETARLRALSVSTLEYMIDFGLAREARLRRHHVDLGYIAEDEHDLLEAMRLSERLRRVDRNVARTARDNEKVRAELLSRGSGGEEDEPQLPAYSAFTTDASHARSGLDDD